MKKVLIFLCLQVFLLGIAKGQENVPDLGKVDLELEVGNAEVNTRPDVVAYKNLNNSNINWNNVDTKKLLSFKDWKEGEDEKEYFPNWENIIRERSNKEIIGHFFQCSGKCRIDRAESFFNAQFRSNLYEGDEVSTLPNSYGWIFLVDGTMIRLAPESSITLNEINIGAKENFVMARINSGNVLWLSRRDSEFIENNNQETDLLFLPPSLYEATPVKDEVKFNPDNILTYLEITNTNLNQYKRLNSLISKTNELVKGKKTYAFIVMPTITVMGYSPNVELISLLGGKGYVKNRSASDMGYKDNFDNKLEYQLRGFENSEIKTLSEGVWYETDEKGRTLNEDQDISQKIVGEFVTKRIPSLLIARELLMNEYSKVCYQESYDRLILAKEEGYRLWGKLESEAESSKKDDLNLRLDYVKEYFRRIETTNLLVAQRFRERLSARGEKTQSMVYGSYFFKKAIDRYFDYSEYSDDNANGLELNSTKKILWKRMHGIK